MKKITITIIAILCVTQIFAQNYSDTIKAKQYYKLGDKYYNENSLDSSTFYYQKPQKFINKQHWQITIHLWEKNM